MNRNTNTHFALNPTNIDMQRSRFDMSFGNKTSFNVGDLVPLCRPIEVLPGDTFSIDTSKVVRLQTLLKPVMDNLYLDIYWFFVPNRLVWKHWKEFMGENTSSAWLPESTYQIPCVKLRQPLKNEEDSRTTYPSKYPAGSIADYMGIPLNMWIPKVSALPFRAYTLVANDWFRSEALTDPLVLDIGDNDITFDSDALEPAQPQQGGTLFKVAKYFDYFTACLPSPQKGPDVNLPLGNDAPVYTQDTSHQVLPGTITSDFYLKGWFASTDPDEEVHAFINNTDSKAGFIPRNLYADLSLASGATINALRTAFQIQKLYERDARGGTRYIEILKSHFGVTSPDSRLQRPEYLGGNRIPISISEVTNNSEGQNTALGNLGGMSRTTDTHSDFTHSFTEHGLLLCLGCARYDHTYSQGLHRSWMRRNRLDFYWPVLANLGEQAVFQSEIYGAAGNCTLTPDPVNNPVFGYNERWAEYRYQPSMITGMMRPALETGLESWHFGDDYHDVVTLSDAWIREDKTNVDRTLAVTSEVADQIFGDFWFNIKATRCMPVYSIPGLIDHH